jgi:hypothetical protein
MNTLKIAIEDAVDHLVALREAHGLPGRPEDVKSQLINYLIAKIEDPSDLLVDTILNTTPAE